MSDLPSPSAARLASPRWLDGRLVVGVLLVLVSVVVGARVVAGADRSEQVWVAARDLAAGTELARDDLRLERVRLYGDRPVYAGVGGASPVGRVLTRPLGSGEFLPLAAVTPVATGTRYVTVPVTRYHYPRDLRRGERVDVYVTPAAPGAAAKPAPQLVLAAATVQETFSADAGLGGGTGAGGVLVAVPVADVGKVVAAVQGGAIDLVRVPVADAPAEAGAS